MKITLLKIGKPAHAEYDALVARFMKRMRTLGNVRSEIVKENQAERHVTAAPGTIVIAMEEGGKSLSSRELAARLETYRADPSVKHLVLVIGGPYGIPDAIASRANERWSLGPGTLTSDLAWLVLAEQIYRAHSILKGTPYHH